MKRAPAVALLLVLAATVAAARPYESDERVNGRRVVILAKKASPPFRIGSIETDGSGRARFVLQDIQALDLVVEAVAAGNLRGEDQEGNPVAVEFYRECRCQDGSVVRTRICGREGEGASAPCEGHDGVASTRYYFLAEEGAGIGFGIDPDILVLVEP